MLLWVHAAEWRALHISAAAAAAGIAPQGAGSKNGLLKGIQPVKLTFNQHVEPFYLLEDEQPRLTSSLTVCPKSSLTACGWRGGGSSWGHGGWHC